VAERLARSVERTLRILMDVRQTPGDLLADVKTSRYLPGGLLEALAAELQAWGVEPAELVNIRTTSGGSGQ
jgi:hypothetical protein